MPATVKMDLKIDRETKNLLAQAATAQGKTLENFVISMAVKGAGKVLRREQTTYLTERDWKRVMVALDSDAEPNAKMKKAMRKYNAIFGGREVD